MSVTVRSHWQFITSRTDDLFAYGDKLMQALLDQEVCVPEFGNGSVAADVERGLIEIEATASGSTLADAVATNRACVRFCMRLESVPLTGQRTTKRCRRSSLACRPRLLPTPDPSGHYGHDGFPPARARRSSQAPAKHQRRSDRMMPGLPVVRPCLKG